MHGVEVDGVRSEMVRGADPLRDLWARALCGEPGALRAVLDGVAPEVTRVVATIVAASERDDAVQETLMALVAALPSFRGESSVRHFARRIAVRTAMRHRLRRRRQQHGVGALDDVEEPAASPGERPDARCAAHRRRVLFRELLADLPTAQAETLAMRVVLGCSLVETAEATGVPVNTVRSRVRLARQALRDRIAREPSLSVLLEVGW